MDLLRSHGLTRHEGELFEHLVLDWLYEYQKANPGGVPGLQELAEFAGRAGDIPVLQQHAATIHQGLQARHLAKPVAGMAGPWSESLHLLPYGQLEAERIRGQRKAAGPRKRACEHALLCWLGDQDVVVPDMHRSLGGFFEDPLGHYWGYPFEVEDVERAAVWLNEEKLIEKAALAGRLTTRGHDCVTVYGGDIGAYKRSNQMSSGQTINVHGDNSGPIGQTAQGNVTQTQHQGADIEKIMSVLKGVRDMIPHLGLEASDGAGLRDVIDEIEARGSDGTLDREGKESLVKRIVGFLERATTTLGPTAIAAASALNALPPA